LLNELRQRTADLTEALEQQTGTSEVLRVISSSGGELEPVFQALLENAVRICEAKFGILFRMNDGVSCPVAMIGVPVPLATFLQGGHRPGPNTIQALAMRAGHAIHILDICKEKGYLEGDPMVVAGVDKGGTRTLVAVPLLKDKVPIGTIVIYRTEVQPFTEKQIELLQNFAAQAVIAIENARLLNELRQRTTDLGRSVDELRALGEVSQAVNSTLDLETVLSTIVARAPACRYQCPRRGEPQSGLSWCAGRKAGVQYHPGTVL
jgi:two-component system NtrC family sensor kinase